MRFLAFLLDLLLDFLLLLAVFSAGADMEDPAGTLCRGFSVSLLLLQSSPSTLRPLLVVHASIRS